MTPCWLDGGNVISDGAVLAVAERQHDGAIQGLAGPGIDGIEYAALGDLDVQAGAIAGKFADSGQPTVARFTEIGADGTIRTRGIVGEPGEEQLLDVRKDRDEKALADGGRVEPGIVEPGIDGEIIDYGGIEQNQVCSGYCAAARIINQWHLIEWRAGIPHRQGGNGVDHLHARSHNLSEHGKTAVLIIQICSVVIEVEKPLAGGAVRVAPEFGHRYGAAQIGYARFIDHRRPGGNRHGHAVGEGEAAALHDKAWHAAMDKGVRVVTIIQVGEEIRYCGGRRVVEELDLYSTQGRFEKHVRRPCRNRHADGQRGDGGAARMAGKRSAKEHG